MVKHLNLNSLRIVRFVKIPEVFLTDFQLWSNRPKKTKYLTRNLQTRQKWSNNFTEARKHSEPISSKNQWVKIILKLPSKSNENFIFSINECTKAPLIVIGIHATYFLKTEFFRSWFQATLVINFQTFLLISIMQTNDRNHRNSSKLINY